jgi:molybdopterin converting factor small subunit
MFRESEAMKIGVALYGAARVVIGQPRVEVSFDTPTIALGQVVEQLIAAYPRARPYLLDESEMLPSHIRILINEVRPDPDATLATVLHEGDRLALLVAVAGGEKPSLFLAPRRALYGKL